MEVYGNDLALENDHEDRRNTNLCSQTSDFIVLDHCAFDPRTAADHILQRTFSFDVKSFKMIFLTHSNPISYLRVKLRIIVLLQVRNY